MSMNSAATIANNSVMMASAASTIENDGTFENCKKFIEEFDESIEDGKYLNRYDFCIDYIETQELVNNFVLVIFVVIIAGCIAMIIDMAIHH